MGAFALSMLVACNAGDENLLNQEGNDLTANSSGASAQRVCPSEEIREEALAKNPELMAKFTENENCSFKCRLRWNEHGCFKNSYRIFFTQSRRY